MKRLLSLVVFAMLCVVALPAEASAQFDLGKAFGKLLGAATPQQTKVSPYDEIRDNAPQRAKLLGTWQYKSAALKYLGDNPLADVALANIEGFGIAELKKRGVMEGCCSLTLRRNGLAVLATRDTLQDGWLAYDESTAKMNISTTVDDETYQASGYIRIVSDRLIVMIDARDVINIVAQASPELANDQTFVMARSVLQNFGDVYLSVIFER